MSLAISLGGAPLLTIPRETAEISAKALLAGALLGAICLGAYKIGSIAGKILFPPTGARSGSPPDLEAPQTPKSSRAQGSSSLQYKQEIDKLIKEARTTRGAGIALHGARITSDPEGGLWTGLFKPANLPYFKRVSDPYMAQTESKKKSEEVGHYSDLRPSSLEIPPQPEVDTD